MLNSIDSKEDGWDNADTLEKCQAFGKAKGAKTVAFWPDNCREGWNGTCAGYRDYPFGNVQLCEEPDDNEPHLVECNHLEDDRCVTYSSTGEMYHKDAKGHETTASLSMNMSECGGAKKVNCAELKKKGWQD